MDYVGWTQVGSEDPPVEMPGFPSGPSEPQHVWEPPRAIPPKTDKHRRARLKALGNSVVPQCALVGGLRIREILEDGE